MKPGSTRQEVRLGMTVTTLTNYFKDKKLKARIIGYAESGIVIIRCEESEIEAARKTFEASKPTCLEFRYEALTWYDRLRCGKYLVRTELH